MDLPAEIRLLVYSALMGQRVDLYRAKCRFCPLRSQQDESALFKSTDQFYLEPTEHANLVCTQILRTSKKIYSEALPVLYANNAIHVECLECERTRHTSVYACSIEPHNITTELTEHYHLHINCITVAYILSDYELYNLMPTFAAQWPIMESQILARYKNTKYISLRARFSRVTEVTFVLARRSSRPTTERVLDYKSVLAEHSDYFPKSYSDPWSPADLEQICDVITLSHARGHLKSTAFGVQSIRWKSFSGNTKEFTLYLGYDKHGTSDTAIENIFAGLDFDERWRRLLAERLMDWAGVFDA